MRSAPLPLVLVLLLAAAPVVAQPSPAPASGPIADSDRDGVPDPSSGQTEGFDNCPIDPNPGQEDSDKDGAGDVCDPCPRVFVERGEHADTDGDGIGDECDDEKVIDPDWEDPNPLGRRLQFFIRPLVLGYRYQGNWVGSTGLGLHLSGSIGEWKFDKQGTALKVPSFFWSAGVYGDTLNVFAAEHLGPYAALDVRPMNWDAYARSWAKEFKFGVGAHLFWSKRVEGVEHRPIHLGVGPRVGFLDIVSLMPFAQFDVANAGAVSWGGMLVFDFKVLKDLGVPLPK